MTLLRGLMEWRVPGPGHRINIGPLLDKQPDHVNVAVVACNVQRRVAGFSLDVFFGPGSEQQLGHRRSVLLGAQMQRR